MPKDRHVNSQFIRDKFNNISRYYDFLNSLLSFGIDHYWRFRAVRALASLAGDVFSNPQSVILDLCAGTLPLTRSLKWWTSFKGRVIALDFAPYMLFYGREKCHFDKVLLVSGDALRLPLKDSSIDAVMVAFGVRNFANRFQGLKEIRRVLRPQGKLVILEFSLPTNTFFREIYLAYLNYLLPKIGFLVSQDKEAYDHLSGSIQKFYTPQTFIQILKGVGFKHVRRQYLTLGIVSLYVAW